MTRFRLTRKCFIPSEYDDYKEYPKIPAIVYFMPGRNGMPAAKGFGGKRSKPDFYIRFRSTERREEYVNNWLDGLRSRNETKATRQAKRSQGHSLKVGDILDSSWGYDQTNIDFYEVIDTPSKCFVTIREIGQHIEHAGQGSDRVTPNRGHYIGGAMRKRASADNYITLTSYSCASPWSGQPRHQTASGWGH